MNQPCSTRLQATYIPEHMSFAFWGDADPAARLSALGMPTGSPGVCRLAIPVDESITATDVGAQLLDLTTAIDAFHNLDAGRGDLGSSLLAWKRVIDTGAHDIPTAAHAAIERDDTKIRSAESTVRLFTDARTAVDSLRRAKIQATLRPYQMQGVAWLTALSGSGGGILADEMGLGKTLQAISMIAIRAGDGPHLVVCPTSVIGNWRREIERFAPHLPLHVHHGAAR
ncbi:SNF2-related protein, partial [Rhodococcus sp. EPR-134]